MKRKVAELPPVTAEEFQRRVLTQKATVAGIPAGVYCNACQKSFSNEKAYNNHLNSKKHKTNERSLSDTVEISSQSSKQSKAEQDPDDDVSEVDSDEWDEDVNCNDCLFCLHHSRNVINNVKHMTLEHSFFVPDVEFCVDHNGLIQYLGEKITQGRFLYQSSPCYHVLDCNLALGNKSFRQKYLTGVWLKSLKNCDFP